MTDLEALAMLYRAMRYLQDMSPRQRTDERRRDYNRAFLLLRDLRAQIEKGIQ
jgi:hypothetical protein